MTASLVRWALKGEFHVYLSSFVVGMWLIGFMRLTTFGLVEDRNEDDAKVQRANRNFARNHAMSIHLNAIALVATVWYGVSLSSRLAMA